MHRAEKNRLVRRIKRLQRVLNLDKDAPEKKKITLLQRMDSERGGKYFSMVAEIQDYHACIPGYLCEIEKGNVGEALHRTGVIEGTLYAMGRLIQTGEEMAIQEAIEQNPTGKLDS